MGYKIMNKAISSPQNPKIKHIKKLLSDKQYRYDCAEYVIEGLGVFDNLNNAKEIYVREGIDLSFPQTDNLYVIHEKLFDLISGTENSQGVLALVSIKVLSAEHINKNGRYVLLDKVQDPGNLGTIIRSACAFGFDGIITTPGTVDPYSPKVVRSAAGTLNQLDIVRIDSISQLSEFNVFAASMEGKDIANYAWPKSFILAIGNEATGLSDELKNTAKEILAIPISLKAESLNAAVSAAIMMYCSSTRSK